MKWPGRWGKWEFEGCILWPCFGLFKGLLGQCWAVLFSAWETCVLGKGTSPRVSENMDVDYRSCQHSRWAAGRNRLNQILGIRCCVETQEESVHVVIRDRSKPMQRFVLTMGLHQAPCSGRRRAQALRAWLAFWLVLCGLWSSTGGADCSSAGLASMYPEHSPKPRQTFQIRAITSLLCGSRTCWHKSAAGLSLLSRHLSLTL